MPYIEKKVCTIWRKCGLLRDFEHFNFLDLEKLRTREKRCPVQSGVVGVTVAKAVSETLAVCVAVVVNINVLKA
jgi:hypothetical protein